MEQGHLEIYARLLGQTLDSVPGLYSPRKNKVSGTILNNRLRPEDPFSA
jgi:hypothetical protein